MKKIITTIYSLVLLQAAALAQETVYPAKADAQKLLITNAIIHVGNGQVIENGTLEIINGKITRIEGNTALSQGDAKVINAGASMCIPVLFFPSPTWVCARSRAV